MVIDLHFDIGLINSDDFFVQFLDLSLKILDLLIHAFNIEFSLPKVLPPLVLLLLQVLLEEAKVAGPFVVDLLAGALAADGAGAVSAGWEEEYQ